MNIKVYSVYTRNLGANLWLLLGAKSMPFGCMSMARLGAEYEKLGAKYMDTFVCMSMPFGCMSMDRLGACMRLLGASMRRRLGAKYMPFGCISDTAEGLPDIGSLPDSR